MALPNFGILAVIVTKIGTVEIDVSPNQNHRYPSRVTENPVEDGTVFSDHQVLMPVMLEIEGRVTDASVSLVNTVRGKGTAKDAFRELVNLQKRREPIDVVTGLAVYQNMMIEELNVVRTASDGQSVRFVATLREIQVIGRNIGTNRDRVADSVRHTALPVNNVGFVATQVAT